MGLDYSAVCRSLSAITLMAGSNEQINPSRLFDLAKRVAPVGRGIVSTLLKVDAWASSIQSDTPAFVPTPLPESNAYDVIEQSARALVGNATGIEKLLLLKSLQEAFLNCIGPETDLTADEVMARLKGFVTVHGKATFIQLFLAVYFSNYVFWDASQSSLIRWLRSTRPLEEPERTIEDIESMCRRVVIAAYMDVKDRSTAEALLRKIQRKLRELLKTAA
jgi:hypothetical protein